MAAAIARGFVACGGPEEMLFVDSGSGRAAALAAETGGSVVATLEELATRSDVFVLAVKPGSLPEAAASLTAFDGPVVSILGATSLADLERALPNASLLRTMPNVAVELGRGVICHTAPSEPERFAEVIELLGRVATLVELPEEQLDAATAVMGCSPAYIARACAALVEAGSDAGLAPETSARLVGLTAAGTGELLLHRTPGDIERAVASPGGSTEAGLRALTDSGAEAAFKGAVQASLERMAAVG